MSEMKRLTAEELAEEDPDSWAAAIPEPEPEEEKPQRFSPEEAKEGAARLCDESVEAETAAIAMTSLTSQAIQHLEETLDPSLVVDAVAAIQRAKKTLGLVEADLARALGRQARLAPTLKTGTGPGYTWEVRGGATRKSWDHDGWKRDVRRTIVDGLELGDVHQVLTDDGEVLPLDLAKVFHEVLALAQAVHGSAEPKATALRPLGIDRDAYCEKYPGPFTLTITADADASTTKEDTTHG